MALYYFATMFLTSLNFKLKVLYLKILVLTHPPPTEYKKKNYFSNRIKQKCAFSCAKE